MNRNVLFLLEYSGVNIILMTKQTMRCFPQNIVKTRLNIKQKHPPGVHDKCGVDIACSMGF